MNKKWKRGSGEAIGFGICMTFMTMFLVYLIGFFILTRTTNQMENAANLIARKIVVCDSIEDARVFAQDKAEEYLTDYMSVISTDSIEAKVEYTAGSDREWEKGNYITLFLTVDIDSHMPVMSGLKTVTVMMMIE